MPGRAPHAGHWQRSLRVGVVLALVAASIFATIDASREANDTDGSDATEVVAVVRAPTLRPGTSALPASRDLVITPAAPGVALVLFVSSLALASVTCGRSLRRTPQWCRRRGPPAAI